MSSGPQRVLSTGSTKGQGVVLMLILMHGLPPSVLSGVGA